jgi:MBG domain (YGX type)/Bacterial Ig-like domain (group 3)
MVWVRRPRNGGTATVSLTVNNATPIITWPPPAPITYPTALSAVQLDATASVAVICAPILCPLGEGVPGNFSYTATPAGGNAITVTSGTELSAASYTLRATFTPTDTTDYVSGGTATVSLTVNPATPTISITSSGTPSTYGTAVTFTATVTVGDTNTVTFFTGSSPLGTATPSNGKAQLTTSTLPAGSDSITASIAAGGNYASNTSGAITQVVNPATPTIGITSSGTPSTYENAVTFTATVTSGDTNTVTFFNGSSPLGTATPSDGKAQLTTSTLPAGSDSITASTAAGGNYASNTSSAITQVVNPAKPIITWPPPAPITYGTALSSVQLDGKATNPVSGVAVAGTYSYSPPAGTLPTAGVRTLSVTFIPSDTVDYTSPVQQTTTLTVNKAVPTCTWPLADAIAYGESLKSSKLIGGNCSSSGVPVSGKFEWTDANLDPDAGMPSESVRFAASNGSDYARVTGSVPIKVNKARQTIDFTPPKSPVLYGTMPIKLIAEASSGLKVKFEVTGSGKIEGSMLTITGAGDIDIAARQEGNDNYDAAREVQHTIQVDKAKLTVAANDLSMKAGDKVPPLTYTIAGFVNGDNQKSSTTGQPKLTTAATSDSKPGSYVISITKGTLDSKDYRFELKSGTLTVTE